MIFADSNIIIDVLGEGQAWKKWSVDQLSMLGETHKVVVNQIVYAEVAPRLASVDQFERLLAGFEIEYLPFDRQDAFEAGVAFQQYRNRRGKVAGSVLPDFFIGGHAQTLGATILTRDPRFYRTYFASVPLITPDEASK